MSVRVLLALLLAACAGTARGQSMPQHDGSVGVRVGWASAGLPIIVSDVAWKTAGRLQPIVQARWDLHAQSVGVTGGAVLEQRLTERLFLREAAQVGPFVSVVDDVAVGLRAGLLGQLGFDVTPELLLAVGPEVTPVVALDTSSDRSTDGRVGCALVGVARWMVVPRVAATLTLAGGYDVGGRGAGAVAGTAALGAIVDW
jgi:hypothetical protein